MEASITIKKIVFLSVIVGGLLSYTFLSAQWSGPTAVAPNNNASTPINISSSYQAKLGDLGAIRMRAGQYCDAAGLNCYTTTDMAGGGSTGITSLASGAGITLTPATITSTGTVAINPNYTQRRVAATCPAGQSIRQINVDGTVVCQINEAPVTCIKNGLQFSPGAGCRLSLATPTCNSGTVKHHYDVCLANGTWNRQFSCEGFVGSPPPYIYPPCP